MIMSHLTLSLRSALGPVAPAQEIQRPGCVRDADSQPSEMPMCGGGMRLTALFSASLQTSSRGRWTEPTMRAP